MKATETEYGTSFIGLENLTLGYGGNILLDGVSCEFGPGSLTALCGRNGTGKSTLLRALARLEKPVTGSVSICGRNLDGLSGREIARLVSAVTTEEIKVADLKAEDIVALGRAPHTDWTGRLSRKDRAAVKEALDRVGMLPLAQRCVSSLSDGERQRVMVARAVAQDTPVILLDEPTAFLDIPNKYGLFSLLRDLAHEEGKCIVCSTHDIGSIMSFCDSIAMIHGRGIISRSLDEAMSDGVMDLMLEGSGLVFDRTSMSITQKTQKN